MSCVSQVSEEPLVDLGAVILFLDLVVDTVSVTVIVLGQAGLQGLDEL